MKHWADPPPTAVNRRRRCLCWLHRCSSHSRNSTKARQITSKGILCAFSWRCTRLDLDKKFFKANPLPFIPPYPVQQTLFIASSSQNAAWTTVSHKNHVSYKPWSFRRTGTARQVQITRNTLVITLFFYNWQCLQSLIMTQRDRISAHHNTLKKYNPASNIHISY